MNTRVQGELFDLATDEVNWQIGVIREELNFDLDFVVPAAETVRSVVVNTPFDGRTLQQWFDSLADATQNKLQQTIQRGVVEGRNTEQIIRDLRGTRSLAYTDGVLNTTRAQTAAVVRTAITHTSAAARQQLFSSNADLMNGVQWVATLDSKTTFICQSRDGKVYPVESNIRPPAHVNCRSSVVAVLKSWREMGIDVDELDPGTRASTNGQVPSTITYPEWLKTQPRSVVEDALGVQKSKLFLDGDLDISRFITPGGRELTLEQIRKREAGAFKRAGL